MKSYPLAMIILHWFLAPIILLALFMGNDIAQLSNDLDLKVDRLEVHMAVGIGVGMLFVIRLFIKLASVRQPIPEKGNKLLAKAATWAHIFIYILVFGVVITGMAIAAQVDMPSIIIHGYIMPQGLSDLPVRIVHGILTKLLLFVVAIHISAAFYHQFVLRDGLLSKMWLSKE
ncbi:cytochrome b [Neptuniibacter caesariensis]|uniref:Cytochrome b561, putative n=1 Tax=Neptuniibacter caesariensis TaxID=207954 RepID=A0A7U8GSE3_NEPCE|nr:cytochrome b/b6 domain-containing protein [Neptuniibacter caesariensis]EAR61316.1 cytochrome b561, putative [Oceanospirillum sp. MED92] [Neptuniibacter caesariensis]